MEEQTTIELRETKSLMNDLLASLPTPPKEGDLMEGVILHLRRGKVYIDLPPWGTGIMYGREYLNARDVLKNANVGDMITAKVVDPENENGYIELSLKEARQALIWSEAEAAIKNKTTLELLVKDANKGGLILEWQGIAGFLPASQLSAEHYPRVEDGNKDAILSELRRLISQRISVQMISQCRKKGNLSFPERYREKDKAEIVSRYNVGDEVECEVTGIVDFGVFLKIEEGLGGLAHISEIDWGLVDDPKRFVRVGEKIRAKVIEIKDGKVSLFESAQNKSMDGSGEKYAKDQIVDGVIIKFNKHGALVSIEEGVAGLAHVSEWGSEDKLREALGLGKTYKFKISL